MSSVRRRREHHLIRSSVKEEQRVTVGGGERRNKDEECLQSQSQGVHGQDTLHYDYGGCQLLVQYCPCSSWRDDGVLKTNETREATTSDKVKSGAFTTEGVQCLLFCTVAL